MAATDEELTRHRPAFRCDYIHISKDIIKRLQVSEAEMSDFGNQIEFLCAAFTRKVTKACETARQWNRANDTEHQVVQPLHLTLTTCHPLEVLQEIDQKIQFAKTMRVYFLNRFAIVHIKLLPYRIGRGAQLITHLQHIRKMVSKMFIDLELIIDRLNNDNYVDGDLLITALDAVMNASQTLFDFTLEIIDVDKQRQALQATTAPEPHPLQSSHRESEMRTTQTHVDSDATAALSQSFSDSHQNN